MNEEISTKLFPPSSILASLMILFFFMPWVNFFLFTGSGYDITSKIGGDFTILWAIPIGGLAIVALNYLGKNNKLICLLTGTVPLVVVFGAYTDIGDDIFQILDFGAYASLLLSVGIILSVLKSEEHEDSSHDETELVTTQDASNVSP